MLQEEIESLKKKVEVAPCNPSLRLRLSFLYRRIGELAQAEYQLREAYRLKPDDFDIEGALYSNQYFYLLDTFLPYQDFFLPEENQAGPMAFSQEEAQAVSLSSLGYLTLWDVNSHQILEQSDGGADLFLLTGAGSQFITFSRWDEIQFRDYSNLAIQKRFTFQTEGIAQACYHPLFSRLYLLRGGSLEMWELRSPKGSWIPLLSSTDERLLNFTISNQAQRVLTLSPTTLTLWDSEVSNKVGIYSLSRSELYQLPAERKVPLFLDQEGEKALLGLDYLTEIDYTPKAPKARSLSPWKPESFHISPLWKKAVFSTSDQLQWCQWEEDEFSSAEEVSLLPPLYEIALSPPRAFLLRRGEISIYDWDERKEILHSQLPPFRWMTASDKHLLFYRDQGATLHLYSKDDFRELKTIEKKSVTSFLLASFSANGKWLAALCEFEREINIWIQNLESGEEEILSLSKFFSSNPPLFLPSHSNLQISNQGQEIILSSSLESCLYFFQKEEESWKGKWKKNRGERAVFISHDHLLVGGPDHLYFCGEEGRAKSEFIELPTSLYIRDIAISAHQSKAVLLAQFQRPSEYSSPHGLFLFSLQPLKLLHQIRLPRLPLSISFRNDREMIVADLTPRFFRFQLSA